MKLYFKPGACSLSPHIVLRELGLPFDLDRVDTKAGKTANGKDFRSINPKGYVPTLQLDDGTVLTEGVAIVQYLADRKPEAGLAPKADSSERYQLQEWLNYIATELHKGFGGPLFTAASDDTKRTVREAYGKKLDFLSEHLKAHQFLLGERFTVADAYLFTVLSWSNGRGIELERWPVLKKYFDRIAARPAVRAATQAESQR
jgi:glutathione S-transferase